MKRELINFIATIGLVLLGAAVVLGVLTAVLFIFPNTTIFGAKAVNERDTQIVYRDEALVDAFANGKFIIESTDTQIEVKMSNKDYTGEGTIVVNESATGIAFNSLRRTLIEWTQTLYGAEDELYYRIKVLEPSGMVFNQKPTTIYINLPHRAPDDDFRYDFVLQDHYGAVNFSFVDTKSTDSDALRIGNLVVESAASVNVPSNKNISVDNVTIKSNSTDFICQAPVLGDVLVTGSNGAQTFDSSIGGRVTIKGGNNNAFVSRGNTAGNVIFENASGSLKMSNAQKLNVNTTYGDISVNSVVNGVTMTTTHGSLWVDEINNGGINFTAGSPSVPNATAAVKVGSRVMGDATVNNYGVGEVALSGVNGDVMVNSCQVGGGAINVTCQSSNEHSVTITGYDGNINVYGINGKTNITVNKTDLGAGAANIYAQFKQVVNTENGTENCIKAGGYVSGHEDWGNVTIELLPGCNNFDLYVYGARIAQTSAQYGYTGKNMEIIDYGGTPTTDKANYINVSGGDEHGSTLHVYVSNTLYLQ